MLGRFVAGLEPLGAGSEFQRADCAPRDSRGNGVLSATDLIQAGRYAAGLDALQPAGGPNGPAAMAELEWRKGQSSQFTVFDYRKSLSASLVLQTRTVRVGNVTGAPGSTINVPVELVALGTEAGLTFSLSFAPSVLTFGQITPGNGLPAGASFTTNTLQAAQGRLGFVITLPAGQSFPAGTRQLLTISFTVAASATGTSEIAFGNQPVAREISDANGNELTATYTAGVITVSGGQNLVPSISGINPNSATAGGAAFTLTVNGANFVNGATVRWNGQNRTTAFVSATQLTAQIPATDVASAGTAQVTVFNPAPGGGTSGSLAFTITQTNPVPTLTSLNPNTAIAGSAAFTLTINGSNFVNGATVRWNGQNRTTTFVSATQLTAQIPAPDIASAGTAQVTVFNPAPGGGASGSLAFTITQANPVPTLTTLNPASVTAGSQSFSLTVNGSNFVNGATVRWNGQNRTTAFVSATQLTAQITAGDSASAGTASVTVFNPAPGGGVSNAVNFTINATTANTIALTPGAAQTGTLDAPAHQGGVFFGPTQYTIQVPAGTTQLRLDLNGNQDVDLYARLNTRVEIQNGRLVADLRSESTTGNEQIALSALSSPILRPGTYYIAISNYGPGAANFTLTATLLTATDEAEQEPNESPATANLLPLAGQRTGNVAESDRAELVYTYSNGTRQAIQDFFKFELTRDTLVDLLLTTPGTTADLDLFLYRDENGTLTPVNISVADLAASGIAFERITAGLKAGRYFVGVSAYKGSASYRLIARSIDNILVSSASYTRPWGLAPESIVSAFGGNLATRTETASSLPLPTTLAGTIISVRDSAGVERLAPLFFAAPTQINLQIPSGTAPGLAVVTITNSNGQSYTELLNITNAAPSLYTGNADGTGVPAGIIVRVRGDGSQSFETIARLDQASNRQVPSPIDLGPSTDTVVLVLFGTGVRGRSAIERVQAKFGSVTVPVAFAGAQGGLVGLDQLNIVLPRSLVGVGDVDMRLFADGREANTVKLNIK